MNILRWFVEAMLVIEGIGVRVGTAAGRLIKLALGLALVWPLTIIAFGMLPHEIARILVPIETLAPLVCLIAAIFAIDPFRLALGTAAILTPPGRKLLTKLGAIIGIELALGIYFTVVPISNNLTYLPLLVLLLVSFLFLRGKMRTAAIVIFAILTIGFFYNIEGLGEKVRGEVKGALTESGDAGRAESTSGMPDGWQPDIISDSKTFDYTNAADEPKFHAITIHLRAGGYNDFYRLPLFYGQFTPTLSHNKGDWVSIWCTGHTAPGAIRHWYEHDNNLGGTMDNCHDTNERTDGFWVQGHGDLTLTVTVKDTGAWGPYHHI